MDERTEWRSDQGEKEVELEYKGKKFTVTVKPLTWSKKNQILSQALSYSAKGEAQFNLDRYNKECLGSVIIKAPWGNTDHIFLSSIDEELGSQLATLIPGPFEGGDDVDFLGKESVQS